ncbi:Nicotinate phosphoribosyltransferase, partial [Perkinsus olseni]
SQNVFLTENGDVRLGYFGLCKHDKIRKRDRGGGGGKLRKTLRKPLALYRRAAAVAATATSSTSDSVQVGTDCYMSPEMLCSAECGKPGDVWSLGCVLFEMCSGKFMWELGSNIGIDMVMDKSSPSKVYSMLMSYMSPHVSPATRSLIKKILDPDPRTRPTIADILRKKVVKRSSRSASSVRFGSSRHDERGLERQGNGCDSEGKPELKIPGLKSDKEAGEEENHRERSSSYIARGYAACESPCDGHAFSRLRCDSEMGEPHSDIIEATFTDLYQISMAYAYWKSGKEKEHAVFDVYFRKCPFGGEFTVCAGIDEVVRYVNTFRFTQLHIDYLQSQMPEADPEFFQYLLTLDASNLTIHAVREGDFVFPREPVLRVAGPLIVCQLMETAILNLVNFPCLVATQAARFRIAAGDDAQLLEFGARRAQGPDGALTASRYAYVGGFDGTSNVKAGHVFGIPIAGTHAHAFVNSFHSLEDLDEDTRISPDPETLTAKVNTHEFEQACISAREELCEAIGFQVNCCNDGELAAFIRYAQAFPTNFLALVDTYETILSGVPNYLSVALGLWRFAQIQAVGIRLDSGDLAYLSMRAREVFSTAADAFANEGFQFIAGSRIVASNDINEAVLLSLHDQPHSIDSFGIGTNLVTCQAQPALGMVYKLVELNGQPRMKLSQDFEKQGVPSRKA